MGPGAIIVFLVVGGVAGWLASLLVRGGGLGIVGNVIVGIVGAFVAGWLFPRFGFALGGGIVGSIIHAAIGAVIVLLLIKLVKKGLNPAIVEQHLPAKPNPVRTKTAFQIQRPDGLTIAM